MGDFSDLDSRLNSRPLYPAPAIVSITAESLATRRSSTFFSWRSMASPSGSGESRGLQSRIRVLSGFGVQCP